MKNKLIIASFALSGLVSAQCNYKCGYNQDENGNTVHLEQCNEYKKIKKEKSLDLIYNRKILLYTKPNGPITPLVKSKWMEKLVMDMVE
tara:strand:- start:1461 stop:1727 length:267 start_codon:yes stop_codon:yes gene_type:complete